MERQSSDDLDLGGEVDPNLVEDLKVALGKAVVREKEDSDVNKFD